jgi:serine/threonine protein phosphatase PrpC
VSSWSKEKLPLKWVEGFQYQGLAPLQEDYFEVNPERGIFILADGFGGSAGKAAAELAVKSMREFLEQGAIDLDVTLPFELRAYYSLAGNVLFNAVAFANHKLVQANKNRSWMESGGASLVAGYLEGRLLSVANVGACSVHLQRGGRVKEVIAPKTLARQNNPFEDGKQSGSQIPLMSFGTVKNLEPEITEFEVQPGDQLCFHTMGISESFCERVFQLKSPQELSQIVDPFEANASALWISF